jgi:threonyl-tRNA synthetase
MYIGCMLVCARNTDKKELAKWKELQEAARQRDHRLVGGKQELFFFHTLSPGSAFWMPHGARIYNTLVKFIREQYWQRCVNTAVTVTWKRDLGIA